MAIIGILMALGTGGYSVAKRRAKMGQARADLEKVRNALEEYRAEYGYYPDATSMANLLSDCLTNTVDQLQQTDPWGNDYEYLRSSRFVYQVWSTGERVENAADDIR